MTFFQKMKAVNSILRSKPKKNPYEGDSRYLPVWGNPPARNTEDWLEMYGRSPRLGIVRKIAEDLSSVDGKLKQYNSKGELEDVNNNHPFFKFWDNPNPLYQFTQEALWQLFETYLLLVGEAFMVIERDTQGYPAELWPIPPSWVWSTPAMGRPVYSIRLPSGEVGEIMADDMFVQIDLNPVDPYGRGLGMAQGIADEVEIDEYAAGFQKRFFHNNATPSSVVAVEDANANDIERFSAEWESKFRGVENSNKTSFVSGKVSVAKLAENMKDMDMLQGRIFMRDTTMEHFSMPKEIMGITENSNRSTAEAAQFIYASQRLTPLIRKRQKAINNQLVYAWGENLVFEFDDIIPMNQEFERETAFRGYTEESLMLNESREKIGMEPVTHGDVFRSQLTFSYLPMDADFANLQTNNPSVDPTDYYGMLSVESDEFVEKDGVKYKSGLSNRDKRAITMTERLQHRQSIKAKTALNSYLGKQKNAILKDLKVSKKTKSLKTKEISDYNIGNQEIEDFGSLEEKLSIISDPIARAKELVNFVEKFHDWSPDESNMRSILANIWEETYSAGQENVIKLYDLTSPYKPEAMEIFKTMGGTKISDDITKSTKNYIVEIIDKGLQDKLDLSEIASKIAESTHLSGSRAELIAKQETNNALSFANHDAIEKNGLERSWVTRGDGKERPNHRKINGQVRAPGERYSNDLMHPCDPNGPADEVMGCRCMELPVTRR